MTADLDRDPTERCFALTPRELEVLRAMAGGNTAIQIGHRLGISPRTAQTHLRNVYVKLEVHNRIQAVRVAIDAGVVRL